MKPTASLLGLIVLVAGLPFVARGSRLAKLPWGLEPWLAGTLSICPHE